MGRDSKQQGPDSVEGESMPGLFVGGTKYQTDSC